jgi:excisionase family DNA binding protein
MKAKASNGKRGEPPGYESYWLRPDQVASYLNCTVEHCIDLIRAGRLPSINVGQGEKRGNYRIRREDMAAFVEKNKS